MSEAPENVSDAAIEAAMGEWVTKAVIGLGLCPFAAPAAERAAIRYCVSHARTEDELVADLVTELETLAEASPNRLETTLLIVPHLFGDFLEFNDLLDVADEVLQKLDLEGEIQVASFHPQYQFVDHGPEDIENYTNRAPWPALHLLREASIEQALATIEDPAVIFENNIRTMRALGHEGWTRLWQHSARPPKS